MRYLLNHTKRLAQVGLSLLRYGLYPAIGRATLAVALMSLLMLATLAMRVPQHASAQATPGTIAYVRYSTERDASEIRLIEPDGSNDRNLWTEPVSHTVSGLAWRPDAAELAFASDHENGCSIFASDIYAIQPDGTGLRRMTNPPACAALASYPKGTVTVAVRNFSGESGLFFVYVQGAPGIQPIILSPGSTSAVTFNAVADFGSTLQQVVVIQGLYRWLDLSTAVDVLPGQTVNAGTFTMSGNGFRQFGAYAPAWRSDGSRLGFILSSCAGMFQVSSYAPDGASGTSVLNTSLLACLMDWGPTPALANQILYYAGLGNDGIYRVSEGSTNGGTKLVSIADTDSLLSLQWLPDGSGFLFATSGDFMANANIYAYNFATDTITPITQFTNEFARGFSISPDGQTIVFERAPALYGPDADLWLMRRDGTQSRLLVQNGLLPAWSLRAPQIPKKVFLPLLVR